MHRPRARELVIALALSLALVGRPAAIHSPPNPWPNEPPWLSEFDNQPWDNLTGAQPWGAWTEPWSWQTRASSMDPSIVEDPTAPFSPLNVLQMIFTPDMGYGREPSVHWIALPPTTEIYTGWWLKLSPNWTCALNEWCTHVTYLFAQNEDGQVYTGLFHPSGDQAGPPYRVGANTEWAPYNTNRLLPNVDTTWVNADEWHRIEFFYRWETSPDAGDGIIRWWVDGVLNGNYTDVHYPQTRGFIEFQLAPTFGTPLETQYMFVDHTYLKTASGAGAQAARRPFRAAAATAKQRWHRRGTRRGRSPSKSREVP
jgi:hypothetical protein